MNEPMGRRGSCKPARLRRTASATAWNGLVLPDDTIVELFLQMEQFSRSPCCILATGDARPPTYHFGDVIGSDLLANHGLSALGLRQLLLDSADVLLDLLHLAIADFGHTAIIAFAFGLICSRWSCSICCLRLTLSDQVALLLPLRLISSRFVGLQVGYLSLVSSSRRRASSVADGCRVSVVDIAFDGLALIFPVA
jgi:hypothetical protein